MPDGAPARLEAIVGLLADRRRRFALYYLVQRAGPVPVEDLARAVAAAETATTPGLVPDDRVDEVYRSLVAVDLPRLASRDLVTFDPLAGLTALREEAALSRRLLALAARVETPDWWP